MELLMVSTGYWLGNALNACYLCFLLFALFSGVLCCSSPISYMGTGIACGTVQQAMYRNRRNFSVVFVLYLPEAAAVSLSSVTNEVVADKSVVLQPVS